MIVSEMSIMRTFLDVLRPGLVRVKPNEAEKGLNLPEKFQVSLILPRIVHPDDNHKIMS